MIKLKTEVALSESKIFRISRLYFKAEQNLIGRTLKHANIKRYLKLRFYLLQPISRTYCKIN